MAGEDVSSVLSYHDATKHSDVSLRMSGHYLDWDNKPSLFKVYRNLPSTPLPHDFPHPRESSLTAIRDQGPRETGRGLNVGSLAEILFFSAGLTRKMKLGSDFHYMRAASATGALYPIELYVLNGDIPGLSAGVYHFNPFDFALGRLREDDYRSQVAASSHETVSSSSLTIALTSLAWRNAWKYEARSYRHWFWDSGVVAANLLATCSSEGLAIKLVMGFVDHEVDRLLGLQERKEATVCLAIIGTGAVPQGDLTRREIPRLQLGVEPSSKDEVDYPIIWETNKASELHSQAEVRAWRESFEKRASKAQPGGSVFQLRALKEEDSLSLREAILRRGSTRRFAQKPITYEALSTIIEASTAHVPLDFLPENETLIDFYLIANDVQGLPPGSYFFDRETSSLRQLKAGRFRHISGYLCLDQLLFSDASVVFFPMADLTHVLSCFGNRGYRAAQFEAGVRAGNVYLSSYSLGIGASGSTFYDDAVTEFFSPHAKDMSAMIAVGVGVPAYKARPGKILPQTSKMQPNAIQNIRKPILPNFGS